jgi:hypothetical protein
MKGKHDDLIMALAMALYVGEHSFSNLQKANDLTKAMLNSWTTDNQIEDTTPAHRKPTQQTPVFGIPGNHMDDQKQLYKDYGWLFGKMK